MSKYVWKPPTKAEIRRAAELRKRDDRMPRMTKAEREGWVTINGNRIFLG